MDKEISDLKALFFWCLVFCISLVCVLALIFDVVADVGYNRSFYLIVQTITTCGYGDVLPRTESAMLYMGFCNLMCSFVALPAIVFTCVLPSRIKEAERRKEVFEQFGQHLDVENFENLC